MFTQAQKNQSLLTPNSQRQNQLLEELNKKSGEDMNKQKTSLSQFKEVSGNNTQETFLDEYVSNGIYQIDEESNTKKSEYTNKQVKRTSTLQLNDYEQNSIATNQDIKNYQDLQQDKEDLIVRNAQLLDQNRILKKAKES